MPLRWLAPGLKIVPCSAPCSAGKQTRPPPWAHLHCASVIGPAPFHPQAVRQQHPRATRTSAISRTTRAGRAEQRWVGRTSLRQQLRLELCGVGLEVRAW